MRIKGNISKRELEERQVIIVVNDIGILLTVACYTNLCIEINIIELCISSRLQWYTFYGKCNDFKEKIVKKMAYAKPLTIDRPPTTEPPASSPTTHQPSTVDPSTGLHPPTDN